MKLFPGNKPAKLLNRKSKIQNLKSFTLIELLVVVAIIAVLISMLLPALANARKKVKDLTCAANLRSVHQGFMLYAGNNRDTLPVMGINNGDPNLNSYIVIIWPYIYHHNPFRAGDSAFRDHIMNSIFRCPVNPCYSNTLAGYASFAANRHLELTNLEQIESPTRKLLVADGGSDQFDEIDSGNTSFIWLPTSGYPLNITYRHDGQANVANVDGHVSRIYWEERYGLYPSGRITAKD